VINGGAEGLPDLLHPPNAPFSQEDADGPAADGGSAAEVVLAAGVDGEELLKGWTEARRARLIIESELERVTSLGLRPDWPSRRAARYSSTWGTLCTRYQQT
jgi:hypothetical protein